MEGFGHPGTMYRKGNAAPMVPGANFGAQYAPQTNSFRSVTDQMAMGTTLTGPGGYSSGVGCGPSAMGRGGGADMPAIDHALRMRPEWTSKEVDLGTTIMAFKYDGGVLLCADARTSTGVVRSQPRGAKNRGTREERVRHAKWICSAYTDGDNVHASVHGYVPYVYCREPCW